jgi:hypothetical protein
MTPEYMKAAVMPSVVGDVQPQYPESAKAHGFAGEIVLRMWLKRLTGGAGRLQFGKSGSGLEGFVRSGKEPVMRRMVLSVLAAIALTQAAGTMSLRQKTMPVTALPPETPIQSSPVRVPGAADHMPASCIPYAVCRELSPSLSAGETLAYDDGTLRTWWTSDRDSLGAAVRFTPRMYPCDVIGALAVVRYDVQQNIYLRVYDDDGDSGKPKTVLYNQLRTDIPHAVDSSYRNYELTSPVTIAGGDFYICFFQKHVWDMIFASDAHFDSVSRQLWYFPDLGWRTPWGMDAADHLIRAKVRYSTGVTEELGCGRASELRIGPNPCRGMLRIYSPPTTDHQPRSIRIRDAAGRLVKRLELGACAWADVDLRGVPDGLYFLGFDPGTFGQTQKLVVQRQR